MISSTAMIRNGWFTGAALKHQRTWENYDILKNVEAFHQYCAALQIDPFPPRKTSLLQPSDPHLERLADNQLPVPSFPKLTRKTTPADTPNPKKRVRPCKVTRPRLIKMHKALGLNGRDDI